MADAKISIAIDTPGAEQASRNLNQLAQGGENVTKSQQRAAKEALALRRQYDPLNASVDRLVKTELDLNRAVQQGAITQDRATRALREAEAQYEQATRGANRLAKANANLRTASRGSRLAMQNFSFQIQDVAVQLSAGTSITQTLTQQLPQLVGGFGAVGAAVGAVIAVAGGLIGAFTSVSNESDETEESVDSLSASLDELAASSVAAGGDLRDAAQAINEMGAAAQAFEIQKLLTEIDLIGLKADDSFRQLRNVFGGTIPSTLGSASSAFRSLRDEFLELSDSGQPTISALEEIRDRVTSIAPALRAAGEAELAANILNQVSGLIELGRQAENAEEFLKALREAQNSAFVPPKEITDTGDAYADLTEKLRETERALEAYISGGEDALEMQRLENKAIQEGTAAFEAYKEQNNDGSKTLQDFIKVAEERLIIEQKIKDAIEEKTEADKEAAAAAQERAREAAKAAREIEREAEKTLKAIDREAQNVFGDIVDGFANGFEGSLDSLRDRFIDFLVQIAYEAAIRPIVLNIAAGVTGAPAGAGLPGGGTVGNLVSLGGAFQNLGTLLTGGTTPGGFSLIGAGSGTLGTTLFGPATASAVPYGTGTALTGGGMFGSNAFLQGGFNNLSNPLTGLAGFLGNFIGSQLFSQSTGSSIGGTLGGALGGFALGPVGALFGGLAGNAIGGLFGTNPASVGATGVAITSDILGAGLPDMITGVDNGGNATRAVEALTAISETARALEADLGNAVRRTDRSFGLDVGFFPSPEEGSGRAGGFTLNRIIDGVKESLDLQGLSGEEVLFEGVVRTLRGAFETLGSSNLDTALQNTAATSIQELVADLQFAEAFDGLFTRLNDVTGPFTQALNELEGRFEQAREKAEELGLSTSDLKDRYSDLVSSLKDEFVTSLEAEVAGVSDEFSSLIQLGRNLAALRDDAESAGVSTELLASVIDTRLNTALDNLDLSSQELTSLIELFEDLPADVLEANTVLAKLKETLEGIGGAAAGALTEEEARSILAQRLSDQEALLRDELSLLEDQIRVEERLTDVMEEAAISFRQAAEGFLTNPAISPLSPRALRAEALSQFEAAVGRFEGGTPEERERAAGRIPALAQTFLEASKALNAATPEFARDFDSVQRTLEDLGIAAEGRVRDIQEESLDALLDQRDAIQMQLTEIERARDLLQEVVGEQYTTNELLAALPSALAAQLAPILDAALAPVGQSTGGIGSDVVAVGGNLPGDFNQGGTALVGGQRVDADAATGAIQGLVSEVAQGGASGVISKAQQYLLNNPDVAQAVAGGAFGGDPISGAINHFREFGQYEGRAFADGGAFTNNIVQMPTMFPMGLMGEAGPEAIMPLRRVGGQLGVQASGGMDQEAIAELRAIRAEIGQLVSVQSQQGAQLIELQQGSSKALQRTVAGGSAAGGRSTA